MNNWTVTYNVEAQIKITVTSAEDFDGAELDTDLVGKHLPAAVWKAARDEALDYPYPGQGNGSDNGLLCGGEFEHEFETSADLGDGSQIIRGTFSVTINFDSPYGFADLQEAS